MTLDKFDKRLRELEARPRQAAPQSKAETRRTLHFLASDPEAGTLYTAALVETANLTCLHTRHGWCRECLDATPTVGAAWQALTTRMAELESLHNQHT